MKEKEKMRKNERKTNARRNIGNEERKWKNISRHRNAKLRQRRACWFCLDLSSRICFFPSFVSPFMESTSLLVINLWENTAGYTMFTYFPRGMCRESFRSYKFSSSSFTLLARMWVREREKDTTTIKNVWLNYVTLVNRQFPPSKLKLMQCLYLIVQKSPHQSLELKALLKPVFVPFSVLFHVFHGLNVFFVDFCFVFNEF